MDRSGRALRSAVSSIKELLTVLTGLTVTAGVLTLLARGDLSSVRPLSELLTVELAFFTLLMAVLVRFYHGNMRHLDDLYDWDAQDGPGPQGRNLGLDFLVVFGLGVVIAAMSLHLHRPFQFTSLFVTLLAVDVLWYLGAIQAEAGAEERRAQKRWFMNNLPHLIALLVLQAASERLIPGAYQIIAGVLIGTNTVIDFATNWDFYFPRASRS